MALSARVRVERDSFVLDVHIEAAAGRTIAILGPNGAGKTTLLRALAGLVPIATGCIRLDDLVLDDPTTRTFVAAEHRPVGLVFQDYLLFPNMTVIENVVFGLRARGADREAARNRGRELLAWAGIEEYAEASPSRISGGQAQRVALARALAVDPRLLLLDEPLAALDVATRRTVRQDLKALLASYSGARILVTHDPRDAKVLADDVVIIENGRVVQSGTYDAVASSPATPYVAELFGDVA